ncbi:MULTISPECIES: cytochrome b [unclassified Acinetobacter]|uniref:cytochrome b n=1 Tax=unclassified Acinetobacter TaxID=196816 RepID=UPI0029346040|nr:MULTISPECIES: cytochrome b/b6 domain-containing protein [unclassified Acinetobacter]WOE32022.1 cytochrome b/b6 domain-containing protein [Acinetobacter sp. SAAs470]WOE37490.1 cytochrome b/b6 domain-containing protein [Acinetobacter sp. SAAs474]
MQKKSPKFETIQSYPLVIICLHWLTVCLVILAYITSAHPIQDHWMGQTHVIAGTAVLIIFCLRLLMIFYYRHQLPASDQLSALQQKAFKMMKFLLYVFLCLVPILGWLALSSVVSNFMIFNISVPLLHLADRHFWPDIHQICANLFISLVGLHATAALIHHFVLRDQVLKSMWLRKK